MSQLVETLSYEPVALTFGTSGLRGLVTDMTDLECYINAKGFLDFLGANDGLNAGDTVYLAGDLRESTPRIMNVMTAAITGAGYEVVNCGLIPTPAIANFALQHDAPCIMVTGSHIPADRNGIKFYKRAGEVLKEDEAAIHAFVSGARRGLYEQSADESPFNDDGSSKQPAAAPAVTPEAAQAFLDRNVNFMGKGSFAGKKVVVYQHSAVGRDMLVALLESLGATVATVDRSDTFVPIDTENVTEVEAKLFKGFSEQHPDAFAIVSTDGDSDRPFVIDEKGNFHRGDVLGLVVSDYLGAKFAAVPISANDAVDTFCADQQIRIVHTRIGSPYVIAAMAEATDTEQPAVGWEVNGGFLTGVDITKDGRNLSALPTRDAFLPILCALRAAIDRQTSLSALFGALPARYTGASLIDVSDAAAQEFRSVASDETIMLHIAQKLFGASPLGDIDRVDVTDGVRLLFTSGDVIHLRASGNAPQIRVYSNTDSQQSADQLVQDAVAKDGHIEQLMKAIAEHSGEFDQ